MDLGSGALEGIFERAFLFNSIHFHEMLCSMGSVETAETISLSSMS